MKHLYFVRPINVFVLVCPWLKLWEKRMIEGHLCSTLKPPISFQIAKCFGVVASHMQKYHIFYSKSAVFLTINLGSNYRNVKHCSYHINLMQVAVLVKSKVRTDSFAQLRFQCAVGFKAVLS